MRDLAFALAGLGLFLTGLHQLAQHLQLLAGPAVRMILARMASGPVSAAGSGLLLGALTQSTSAAAFVCIGLLNAGSLSFASALTLSAWASVGTAVLVFLASIDVLLLGLYGLGAIGMALLFNLNRYQIGQRVIGLGFALGILLAGLGLIKQGGALLEQSEWALEFFIFAGETAVIAFLVGVIVTLIVQSSATVSILAVTLNVAGALPLDQAALLVCGASVGSGFSVVLVTSHLSGVPRRLALWQGIVKVVGVALTLPVLALSDGLASAMPLDALPVPVQIALLYLVLQVAGALGAGLAQARIVGWLTRLTPEPESASRFAVRYIDYLDATRDLETALALARQEQLQLIAELPATLDPLRPDEIDPATVLADAERQAAALLLNARIGEFLAEALRQAPPGERLPAVFAVRSRNEALRSLQGVLHDYVGALGGARAGQSTGHSTGNPSDSPSGNPSGGASGIGASMTESLHLILTVLVEYARDAEHDDALLRELTADRSGLMEGIRAGLLRNGDRKGDSNSEAGDGDRQALLMATSLFERAVWLVRQVAFAGR